MKSQGCVKEDSVLTPETSGRGKYFEKSKEAISEKTIAGIIRINTKLLVL